MAAVSEKEIFIFCAKKLAGAYLGGTGEAAVGEVLGAIAGLESEGNDLRTILAEQADLLKSIIADAFAAHDLEQATRAIGSATTRLGQVYRAISQGGRWWERSIVINRLTNLEQDLEDCLSALERMGLAGYQPYMMAASLRLRVHASVREIPDERTSETANLQNSAQRFIRHHERIKLNVRTAISDLVDRPDEHGGQNVWIYSVKVQARSFLSRFSPLKPSSEDRLRYLRRLFTHEVPGTIVTGTHGGTGNSEYNGQERPAQWDLITSASGNSRWIFYQSRVVRRGPSESRDDVEDRAEVIAREAQNAASRIENYLFAPFDRDLLAPMNGVYEAWDEGLALL